jgi:threonine dehydrogenase-like Zn-dependent dehydrogenase
MTTGPRVIAFDDEAVANSGSHADPFRRLPDADAIVRVDATTICGTDLHILKGDVPSVTPGRILGHEAVGTVEQVGSSVRTVGEGDRVLVSCISACGSCRFCRESRYGQCRGGGWILGHTYDGVQAEFARVPFADNSVYRLPDSVSDEDALMLADGLRSRRSQRPDQSRRRRSCRRIRPGGSVGRPGCPPVQPEQYRGDRSCRCQA